MADQREKRPSAHPTKKSGLRLIKCDALPAPENAAPGAVEPKAPRPKSNLAQLMTAYADAIDRDIKILLDL